MCLPCLNILTWYHALSCFTCPCTTLSLKERKESIVKAMLVWGRAALKRMKSGKMEAVHNNTSLISYKCGTLKCGKHYYWQACHSGFPCLLAEAAAAPWKWTVISYKEGKKLGSRLKWLTTMTTSDANMYQTRSLCWQENAELRWPSVAAWVCWRH